MKILKEKRWLFVLVAVLVLAVYEKGCADTPEQIKNAEELEKYMVHYDTPKCPGDILVDLGGIKIMVPRNTWFTDKNGESIKRDLRHPLYDCSINSLSDIGGIFWGSLKITSPPDPNLHAITTYIMNKKFILAAQENEKITTLPNGIRRIDMGFQIYLLPQDKAPTGNGEPVTLWCNPEKDFISDCDTFYFLPNGLGVHYMFQRKLYSEDQYLEADRERRDRIESMIEKAQQPEN